MLYIDRIAFKCIPYDKTVSYIFLTVFDGLNCDKDTMKKFFSVLVYDGKICYHLGFATWSYNLLQK